MLLAVALGRAIALVAVTAACRGLRDGVDGSRRGCSASARAGLIVLGGELATAARRGARRGAPPHRVEHARRLRRARGHRPARRRARPGRGHGPGQDAGRPLGCARPRARGARDAARRRGALRGAASLREPARPRGAAPSFAAFSKSPRGGRARRASEAGPARTSPARATRCASCETTPRAIRSSASRGKPARDADGCSCARWSARSATSSGWCWMRRSSSGRERRAARRSIAPWTELASIAVRHLRRGDRVGLVVAASRCARGSRRTGARRTGPCSPAPWLARRAASTPIARSSTRSRWGSASLEHARPLDLRGLTGLRKGNLDGLAARADQLRARAPFAPRVPFAHTAREQSLRHYLAGLRHRVTPARRRRAGAGRDDAGQVLDKLPRAQAPRQRGPRLGARPWWRSEEDASRSDGACRPTSGPLPTMRAKLGSRRSSRARWLA
jgi:hypothetical protein